MVLQLCGRVCRRLSFENPSSIDEGFFVLKSFFGLYVRFLFIDRIGVYFNLIYKGNEQ